MKAEASSTTNAELRDRLSGVRGADMSADIFGLDIAGFSRTAERLIQEKGGGAAEELTAYLTNGFSAAAAVLDRHGFAVADLLGDGIIASRPAATRSSASHARISEDVARAFGDATGLQCRASTVTGTFSLARVGGFDGEWHTFATGAGVVDLHDRLRTQQRARDLQSQSRQNVLGFLAKPARAAHGAAPSRRGASDGETAEIRSTTVLFVRLVESTRAAEIARERVQAAVLATQQVCSAHMGHLEKVTHDEKGLLLRATFRSSRDVDGRALLGALDCAFEIASQLEALGFSPRLGLSEGPVYHGPIFLRDRSLRTIQGPAANMAAKISVAGKGLVNVVVTDTRDVEARLRQRRAEWSRTTGDLGDYLAIASSDQAVVRKIAPEASRMIGRDGEIAKLRAACSAEAVTVTKILALVGPAGIGKTRLIEELTADGPAHDNGYVARADPRRSGEPIAVWKDMAGQVLERMSGGDRTKRRPWIDNALDVANVPQNLRSLCNEIAPGTYEAADLSNDIGASTDQGVRRETIERILAAIFNAASSSGPLILVVDDAHWMGGVSWETLGRIRSSLGRTAVIVAFREDHPSTDERVRAAGEWPQSEVMRIGPLSVASISALVKRLSPQASLEDHVIEELATHAGGNPLFAEQATHWLGARSPRSANDNAVGLQNSHNALQEAIGQILDARIDRLSQAQTILMRALAVVDQPITSDEAAALSPSVSKADAEAAIQALAASAYLRRDNAAPARYSIRHGLISDAIARRAPPSELRNLHQAVASLWRLRKGDYELRGRSDALIGHHLAQGAQPARAAISYARAGAQALAVGAYGAALEFYEIAIAQAEKSGRFARSPRVAEWHAICGRTHWALGDLNAAHAAGNRAMKMIDDGLGGPRWLPAIARGPLGILRRGPLLLLGLKSLVLPQAWRAAAIATSIIQGETAYYLGESLVIVSANVITLSLAGDPRTRDTARARGFAFLGFLAGLFRLSRLARAIFAKGAAIGDPTRDGRPSSYAVSAESVWHLGFGRWNQAKPRLARAAELVVNPADAQQIEIIETLQALSAYFQGEWDECHRRFARVHELALKRGNRLHLAWAEYGMAEALLVPGRLDEASALLASARDRLKEQEDRQSRLICAGLLADLHLRRGDTRAAAALAGEAIDILRRLPANNFGSLEGFAATPEVLLRLCLIVPKTDAHAANARYALKRLKGFAQLFPIAGPRLMLCLALEAKSAGKTARAEGYLRKGLALAEQLGMKYEAAKLRSELGTAFNPDDGGDGTHVRNASGSASQAA